MADSKVIMYGHPTCPQVGPVKGILTRSKVSYEYVNIHQDSKAAAQVRAINNGHESVPTLVFPDGTSLTEPSFSALKAKLESLGYRVDLIAWVVGNAWSIFIGGVVLFALLRFLGVF